MWSWVELLSNHLCCRLNPELQVVCAASYGAAMQAAHMSVEDFQTLKSRGARICALDVSLPDSIG